MAFLPVFITILIILELIGFITWFIIVFKSGKELAKSDKAFLNGLHKFNNNHEVGNLISKTPCGYNFNHVRIIYAAKEKDAFDKNKENIVYEAVVAHKDRIEESDRLCIALPNKGSELPKIFRGFRESLRDINYMKVEEEANDNFITKLEERYRQKLGHVMDESEINKMVYANKLIMEKEKGEQPPSN